MSIHLTNRAVSNTSGTHKQIGSETSIKLSYEEIVVMENFNSPIPWQQVHSRVLDAFMDDESFGPFPCAIGW